MVPMTRSPCDAARPTATWRRVTLALALCASLGAATAVAADEEIAAALGDLTIEQLLGVRITSVSKKAEALLSAASAIYVITAEDIRRSGATSIPEALRMAPGIQVARITGNRWAISARGFNGEFANKLLVLMDGRTVYDPAFSGVYWDAQDTLLEDVDRIEVIRGPGATLWGANAVNGVINIITKGPAETQGLLITGGAGNQETGFGGVRYGGTLGTHVRYRLFAKYFDRTTQAAALGVPASDDWNVGRGGFRFEWAPLPTSNVTLQGDWYRGGEDATFPERDPTALSAVHVDHAHIEGRNVLARWRQVLSDRSEVTVQTYYDHTKRHDENHESTDTIDLTLEHHVGLWDHDLVWGLGYRWVSDAFDGNFGAPVDPAARQYSTFSGFVQDQIPLVADRLRLTLGTKLEHNAFSGFEIQPSAALVWTPHQRHAVWLSVSRAVRTPARSDQDLHFVLSTFPTEDGAPGRVVILGDHDFESEKLLSYELGYRVHPWEGWFLDVAGFYSTYDDLATTQGGLPRLVDDGAPHPEVPIEYGNEASGNAYGIETALNWQATPWWRFMLASTFLKAHVEVDSSGVDVTAMASGGDSPQHQFHLRSFLSLPRNFELDTALYYVDILPNQGVPSYVRVDARLGWHPVDSVELSLVLQDAFQEQHLEFGNRSGSVKPTEIERSVYGKITLRF